MTGARQRQERSDRDSLDCRQGGGAAPPSAGNRMNSTRRKRIPRREPSRGGPTLDPGGELEGVCRPVDVSPAAPPYHWPPATRTSGM